MEKQLAKRMRELRERTGRTQQEVADLLGVGRQTYNAYESGTNTPKTENILQIARILRTTPDYLLGWDEEQLRIASAASAGNVLRRLMAEKNITMQELAEEFQIPLKTLRAYENGTTEMPHDIIAAFAKYFGVDMESIIALEMESQRVHTVVTTSRVLSERYKKWQAEIGYNHFSDEEIDELISFAKYITWRRDNLKGGGKNKS